MREEEKVRGKNWRFQTRGGKKKKSTLHYHLIRSWGKSVTNSRYQCKLEAGKKWFGRMTANRSICASRLATHFLTQKPCVQAEHFFSALVWLLHSGKQLCTCGLMAIETFCVPSSQSYSISVKWQFPYLQHICTSDIQYTLWSLFKMFKTVLVNICGNPFAMTNDCSSIFLACQGNILFLQ